MKKVLFVLFALVTLGAASAMPLDEASNGGGNQVDGTRSIWAG